MSTVVHMLGDSTQDNIFWRLLAGESIEEAKQSSIVGQLKERLPEGIELHDASFDGFTTRSLLEGDRIGSVLEGFSGNPAYQSYMEQKGNLIHFDDGVCQFSNQYIRPLDKVRDQNTIFR